MDDENPVIGGSHEIDLVDIPEEKDSGNADHKSAEAEEFVAAIELKRLVFPKCDAGVLESLRMTRESVYSTSPPDQSKIIVTIAQSFMDPAKSSITDATSNIGGNLYAMIPAFKEVNAVEIDQLTYDILKSNVAALFPSSGVLFVHDDYTKIFAELRQDIVFLDPPWGGLDYYKKKNQELYMSDVPLNRILTVMLPQYAKLVIVKVPSTYPHLNYANRWKFSKRVPIRRKGRSSKDLYHIMIMSNVMPKKPIKKEFWAKHLNYRKWL